MRNKLLLIIWQKETNYKLIKTSNDWNWICLEKKSTGVHRCAIVTDAKKLLEENAADFCFFFLFLCFKEKSFNSFHSRQANSKKLKQINRWLKVIEQSL